MPIRIIAPMAALALAFAAFAAQADTATAEVRIKNHRFHPAELRVPAGQRIKLTVHNDDATPEEFESQALRVEKIVTGNNDAVVYFGPLDPGEYHFFGEFHQATAQGKVIAE